MSASQKYLAINGCSRIFTDNDSVNIYIDNSKRTIGLEPMVNGTGLLKIVKNKTGGMRINCTRLLTRLTSVKKSPLTFDANTGYWTFKF